jgi:hypothetical protein
MWPLSWTLEDLTLGGRGENRGGERGDEARGLPSSI